MFSFWRRTTESLHSIENVQASLLYRQGVQTEMLRKMMTNQETFDAYAAQIVEQNSQIRAAVAVIVSEIKKLQAKAATPLDTSKMDAALIALADAVDSVEAIPTPEVEDEEKPVAVEDDDEPVEVDMSEFTDRPEV